MLHEEAGVSDKAFQNGWLRDRAADGTRLPERTLPDGRGLLLSDFLSHESAQTARLSLSHVLALRLYTTSAYESINKPLRQLMMDENDEVIEPPHLTAPHPLPCTLSLIYEGLKRLRGVHAGGLVGSDDRHRQTTVTPTTNEHAWQPLEVEAADGGRDSAAPRSPWLQIFDRWRRGRSRTDTEVGAQIRVDLGGAELAYSDAAPPPSLKMGSAAPTSVRLKSVRSLRVASQRRRLSARSLLSSGVLWRGMRDLTATDQFMKHGGSELAPCSTTGDVRVAVLYARGRSDQALIFRIIVSSFMKQGADLRFLSAFPHECEALYPPLTFLQPLSKAQTLKYDGVTYTIVDVEPNFPS